MRREPDINRKLHSFLADIEGRAFRIAQVAAGNRDDALELVQEAMMKLVQNYSERGEDEWKPLFYSILQTRILDWRRRQSVRNRFRTWFAWHDDTDEDDALEQHPADDACEPSRQLENEQFVARLNQELGNLPYRQQQVFLLRVWEGLDIVQVASIMQCSESSVKTHHARALEKLRTQLGGMR